MSGWGDLLKGKFKEVIDKSTGEKIMVDVNSREYDLDDSGNIVGGLPDDGAAPASKGPAPTGFVFGGAPASGAAPTFSFGVPPAGGGGSGGFSFGVPAPSTTPAFGAPPVFGAPQPSASIFGGFGSAGAAAPERRKRKASNQLGKAVGDVYVAGNGDCSQMGLGEDEGRMECAIPERLPALSKQGVLTIACGGMHTVALTEGGVLWSWGCNDDCALGRDGEEAWPAVVAGALRGERVVAVTAGDCHSVALVADGRVFSWGTYKDSNGYIGYAPQPHGGKREKADAPALVPGLDGVCITSIASGSNHTLAAVRGEPWVFAWGCGEQGQLGREVSKETRVAHLVPARPALTVGARAGDDGVRPACNGGPAEKRAGVPSLRVLNANLVTYVGALARTDPAGDWSDVMDEYIAYKRDLPAPAIGAGSFAPPGGASAPVPIAEVFCGSYHSFALGTDGSVHAFGLNNMGQLGLGQADKAPRLEPTRVRGARRGRRARVRRRACVGEAPPRHRASERASRRAAVDAPLFARRGIPSHAVACRYTGVRFFACQPLMAKASARSAVASTTRSR